MRTWEVSEFHHILYYWPKMCFRGRFLLSPVTWYYTYINVTECHVLLHPVIYRWHFQPVLWLPVDTALVKCAFFMLRNTGLIWSFLLPLASRQREMRVNWISVVSDRSIMVQAWPSGAELATGKTERDKSQGLCSLDPLRYTPVRLANKYKHILVSSAKLEKNKLNTQFCSLSNPLLTVDGCSHAGILDPFDHITRKNNYNIITVMMMYFSIILTLSSNVICAYSSTADRIEWKMCSVIDIVTCSNSVACH